MQSTCINFQKDYPELMGELSTKLSSVVENLKVNENYNITQLTDLFKLILQETIDLNAWKKIKFRYSFTINNIHYLHLIYTNPNYPNSTDVKVKAVFQQVMREMFQTKIFEMCLSFGRPTLVHKIVGTETLVSLLQFMPSILPVQAANISQRATREPEGAVDMLLGSVTAGNLWIEFIQALRQFPILKDCVEIFKEIPLQAGSINKPEVKPVPPVTNVKPAPASKELPKTAEDFENCLAQHRSTILNAIVLSKTLTSLIAKMPSYNSMSASNCISLANTEPENAVNIFLGNIVATGMWNEFIDALDQFPVLKACREVFGTASSDVSKESFPPITQIPAHTAPPNYFVPEVRIVSRPVEAVVQRPFVSIATHLTNTTILQTKKSEIKNAIIHGDFASMLVDYIPTLSQNTEVSAAIRNNSRINPGHSVDLLCDWVIRNKSWIEFINALSSVGLTKCANLFPKQF